MAAILQQGHGATLDNFKRQHFALADFVGFKFNLGRIHYARHVLAAISKMEG